VKRLQQLSRHPLQLVGMSATVGNVRRLADWSARGFM
jgi:replicative superfamily II helicase